MSDNEFEQFAAAFRCPIAMAEPTVNRIRQRIGTPVPMPEILAAIKKIAPSRLSTDTLVIRLQKDAVIRSAKPVRKATSDPTDPDRIRKPKAATSSVSAKTQISALLSHNWAKAAEHGLTPPKLGVDKFVRAAQAAAGEPKPTVVRILEAIEKLSKMDVLITPNLVADDIIETDKA
ncbi:MAG TPA: hypothetical protein VFK30_16130 [Anaerolineae bacterium]|nr:hypothetical protein [Anaerolineae bacterium]